MGRTSRIYELAQKLHAPGMTQGNPLCEEVFKVAKTQATQIADLQQRVATLEHKDKGGKEHGH